MGFRLLFSSYNSKLYRVSYDFLTVFVFPKYAAPMQCVV